MEHAGGIFLFGHVCYGIFTLFRPYWLYCEAPEIVHRGETVGLKCTIFNWTPEDVEVVLILLVILFM